MTRNSWLRILIGVAIVAAILVLTAAFLRLKQPRAVFPKISMPAKPDPWGEIRGQSTPDSSSATPSATPANDWRSRLPPEVRTAMDLHGKPRDEQIDFILHAQDLDAVNIAFLALVDDGGQDSVLGLIAQRPEAEYQGMDGLAKCKERWATLEVASRIRKFTLPQRRIIGATLAYRIYHDQGLLDAMPSRDRQDVLDAIHALFEHDSGGSADVREFFKKL